jgi:hypothetical protein
VSELDVAKEQIAYLKFWLGILVVTDISLFGWLLSNVGGANPTLILAGCFCSGADYRRNRAATSPYRATNQKFTGALAMEIIVAALLVAVSLVLLALAVDATRHPK